MSMCTEWKCRREGGSAGRHVYIIMWAPGYVDTAPTVSHWRPCAVSSVSHLGVLCTFQIIPHLTSYQWPVCIDGGVSIPYLHIRLPPRWCYKQARLSLSPQVLILVCCCKSASSLLALDTVSTQWKIIPPNFPLLVIHPPVMRSRTLLLPFWAHVFYCNFCSKAHK